MTIQFTIQAPGGDMGSFDTPEDAAAYMKRFGFTAPIGRLATPPDDALLEEALSIWRTVSGSDEDERLNDAIARIINRAKAGYDLALSDDDALQAIRAAIELERLLTPDLSKLTNPELARLLIREEAGHVISAAKRFREIKGTGIRETRELIETAKAQVSI